MDLFDLNEKDLHMISSSKNLKVLSLAECYQVADSTLAEISEVYFAEKHFVEFSYVVVEAVDGSQRIPLFQSGSCWSPFSRYDCFL